MPHESALASLPAIRVMGGAARARALKQDAVATSAQLVTWGFGNDSIERRVARGEWQRVYRGVIALQSGPLTWRQRARGALLYAGPGAALSHRSAAYVREVLPSPGTDVHVMVPHARTVRPQAGLVVHRRRQMPWAGGGLRAVDAEEAVLCLVAEAAGDDEFVGLVCDAVRGGAGPDLLLRRATQRARLRNRTLLVEVLGAVEEGIESALEHRYRRDVEQAHGLPRATAQKRERVGGRWIRADRVYDGFGVRTELDGQLAHPFGATDDDVWRDNAVLLSSRDLTLRYRWRHVAVTPCATAAQVGEALAARGWPGRPRPCGPACPMPAVSLLGCR